MIVRVMTMMMRLLLLSTKVSEPEVPVNTPVSTRTRAGRLSIPNSRYLDWLA